MFTQNKAEVVVIMNLLSGLFDNVATVLCFLRISNNCIPPQDQHINFYQWTNFGRIELTNNYSTVNSNSNTVFIVHGWTENSSVPIYETIAKNYLIMNSTYNVILVDYQQIADENYLEAQQMVAIAGTLMGNKIVEMLQLQVVHVKRIQIFCHSLGTHVSGQAARIIKTRIGDKIARISATDPAGPLFRFPIGIGALMDALSADDCDFLDITHTSATLGTLESFGTVDTYVGLLGAHQPGCSYPELNENLLDELVYCDHRIGREYFAESILSCGFLQKKNKILTSQLIIYGQHIPLSASGIYTMDVNAHAPYATNPNTYPSCVS